METATKLSHMTDADGFGTCQACDREGLRWLCHLTDGSVVGVECAKQALGFKPAPKMYRWMDGYTLTATTVDCGQVWALYTHANGTTALTMDGRPQQFGGADQTWARRGYPVPAVAL